MTITAAMRLAVRQRAGYACEYCGVTETAAGGELTIDHVRPIARGGTDHLDNLVYCCSRCNLHKSDYYPSQSSEPSLWNPRVDPADSHFLLLADGVLHPTTATGAFTIRKLRLNRRQLVAHRRYRHAYAEIMRLLSFYRELQHSAKQFYEQQAILLEAQQALLNDQHALIELLIERLDRTNN